jgi:hypothetical protein
MPDLGTFSPGDILTAADLNAIGVWTSYTPTLVQNGTRSATVNYAEYVQINDLCVVNVDLTCTTTGSAGNIVTVSMPISIAGGTQLRTLGSGFFFDSSGTDVRLITPIYNGTTTVRFLAEATTDRASGLGANPSIALGADDVISFSVAYEVA